MNCPIKTQENRDWLLDYAAGRLDSRRAMLVDEHMAACAACARFVKEQQVVWNALSQWEPQAVSADFDRRLYGAIDGAKPVSWIERMLRPLKPMLWRPAVPLVAACLLIVVGVLLHSPQAGVAPPVDSQARVEKIEPEQVERTVDDMLMLRELTLSPPPRPASKSM
jgi:anti-sigma factor RsiW